MMQPAALPEPETLFDSLLARKEFKEYPNKISSMLFYLASIIIHGMWPDTSNFRYTAFRETNHGQIFSKRIRGQELLH